MTGYRITKSPFRQFLLGLVGIVLVLAAMDVLWLHKVSSEPLENDAGEITTRGEAWRRTDLIWGSLFLISGAGLFVGATIGLASGMAVAEIADDGLRLRVGGPRKTVTFAWADLVEVRSALADGDGVQPRPVLMVIVEDPSRYPSDVWGGDWIDGVLHVDADGWSERVEELVVRVELDLEARRRRSAVADGGDPEEPQSDAGFRSPFL
ncbi:MAG: hypothetical protein OEM97_09655 [Acidimicrobiia bacterium]|nr:hypothetical protein [Acidimicrobiia bacterium]